MIKRLRIKLALWIAGKGSKFTQDTLDGMVDDCYGEIWPKHRTTALATRYTLNRFFRLVYMRMNHPSHWV